MSAQPEGERRLRFVVGRNDLTPGFFDDLEAIPMEDRNILRLVFTQSDWRVTIVDWYDVVGRLVAEFRAAMAERLDDAAYVEGGSSSGCGAPHRRSPPSGSGVTSRASRAARSALGTRPWAC